MLKYLESALLEKTKGTRSEILYAQWNYDKQIISSALNAISMLFPHYSLHDETHSTTIINNIVRVIGKDNIDKLSSIDIWLILEASFCHDIGMVVPYDELESSLKSDEFIDFFKTIKDDRKNGLHEFANQFEIENKQIKYKSSILNLAYHDGIKFILADFFRKKHADRSKNIIENPARELKLSTPRGAIPKRMFKILGNICSSHTKSFDEVMKLPFCEVGIDIEDTHPRFISCLLRIGDLLDLDNNRFSEVMLRTVGKAPVDTLNHKTKHLSIESFRADNTKIEISAKCNDYDTANLTQHWLNYLNSEISQQMINWNNIVPSKEFGYLPTIGNLKVELLDYEEIDGKKKPQFSVDTDKAMELLQGTGLYEGAYQSIREILQNAVDATLLKIWLECEEELKNSTPQSDFFKEIVENYPIKLTITEKGVVEENKLWEFCIEDKGIGLSSDDLSYLMKTGSSSKNRNKQNIIDNMPYWLRPSGTFGIGFQSIFMLTDRVEIETKSFFNEEFQIIELNDPNSVKDGGILIQKKKTNHKTKPGSKIKFLFKTKAIPSSYSIKMDENNASRILHNYDPFENDSLDIEIGKIFDEVFKFANMCYVPLNFYFNREEIATNNNTNKFNYFDEENALELNVYCGKKEESYRTTTYYKNQPIDNSLNISFLGFSVNIHKNKASEVLTLNRNKIKSEYYSQLMPDIFKSSFSIITKHFYKIFDSEEKKAIGSMYLHYYYETCSDFQNFDISRFNQWEKLKIQVGKEEKEISQLINEIDSLKLIDSGAQRYPNKDEYDLNCKDLSIKTHLGYPAFHYTDFFLQKIKEKLFFNNIEYKEKEKEITFSKSSEISINTENYKKILNSCHFYHSTRQFVPCLDKYSKLKLKDNVYKAYVSNYRIYLPYSKMLSPFVSIEDNDCKNKIEVKLTDKLYQWVYENRYDEKTKLEEIKSTYNSFTKEFSIEK